MQLGSQCSIAIHLKSVFIAALKYQSINPMDRFEALNNMPCFFVVASVPLRFIN